MKNCEQMKGLSVLEHGQSVHSYFIDLYNHIMFDKELKYEWNLPDWVFNKDLWNLIEDLETIKNYQIFHDCGKPFCLTIDDDGKKHFPDHAAVSHEIWSKFSNNKTEKKLILHDMDIHILRGKDIDDFCSLSIAPTLLITGLCELHSNASMFGGIESTSFKIKFKNIKKFGNRITKQLTTKVI